MSIEDITELGDLFEYDEFDSYDEHAYQEIVSDNVSNEEGVPLSVELSESLNKVQTPECEQATKSFTKAPEIFLRIDVNSIAGGASSANSSYNITCTKSPNIIKQSDESNSIDSIESNEGITNRDECTELQYENEFSTNDEIDCENVQSTCKRHNSIDNEYEELLFEGINFKSFPY